MRSVMHHAEHGSSTTAVCTLRSDGLGYDSRETPWQMTPFARPARTCPFRVKLSTSFGLEPGHNHEYVIMYYRLTCRLAVPSSLVVT